MMKRACRCMLLASAIALISGCAGAQRTPAPLPASQHFEVLEPLPAGGFVRAADVYDWQETSRRYIVLDENGQQTSEIFIRRRATERYGAGFSDDEGMEAEFWQVDEHGAIVLHAHVNQQEKTVTHFRPPLTIMPAQLYANDTFTSEAAMRVVDMNNPTKVREQGQARRAVSYVGDQRVRTARGELTAQRLEIKFIADMRFADAEERTILFIVPGEGVIARQTEVTVKVLGTLSNTQRRTLVRVD